MKKSFRGSVGSRWSLAAVLAVGLSLAFASPASAAPMPDASVTQLGANDPTMGSLYKSMAQTFKAQHQGQIVQVDLHYGNNWFATSVRAEIWNVSSQGKPVGLPITSVPAAKVYPFTTDWHGFTLTTPVQVDVGQALAIVLTSGTVNSNRWSYNTAARYNDGQMLALSGSQWTPFSLTAGSAFLFRTWVDSSPEGPSVTADNPAGASADEATAPTATGTYTNPAGGAVQLTADHGQVTDLGGGKWSWKGDVYDEDAAPATVTIKLTDSLNRTASTTFPLTITRVKPTAGISTGTLKATAATQSSSIGNPEGTTLTLNGSAVSADPADQAGVFTYRWTVTRNGVLQPPSAATSYAISTPDEGDTYVVTLTVTDDGGVQSDPVSVTVVGSEVKPAAIITSVRPADSGITFITTQETINFAGNYSDPAPETHTYRWDFGDGASATTQNASHAYSSGGLYTVTLTVKDDEGAAGAATTTVKVLSTQDALAAMIAFVKRTSLDPGLQNSLIVKLNAASDAAARGNNTAAGNQLTAFLNELEADLRTGKISASDYNALRADAHEVQASLGTFNRFLEWWPLPA